MIALTAKVSKDWSLANAPGALLKRFGSSGLDFQYLIFNHW